MCSKGQAETCLYKVQRVEDDDAIIKQSVTWVILKHLKLPFNIYIFYLYIFYLYIYTICYFQIYKTHFNVLAELVSVVILLT